MKTYLVTLKNEVGSEVTALTATFNEISAKEKALLTAHQFGTKTPKSFLNTEFKVTEVEEWDPSKSRVLSGVKRFGLLTLEHQKVNEDLITDTAGIKSALTKYYRNYVITSSTIVYIVDIDDYKKPQQTPQVQPQQVPNLTTIAKTLQESPEYDTIRYKALVKTGKLWYKNGYRRIYFSAAKLEELTGLEIDADLKYFYDAKSQEYCIDGSNREQIIEALERRVQVLFVNDRLNEYDAEKLGTTLAELRKLWGIKEYILSPSSEPKYINTPLGEVFVLKGGIVVKKLSSKYVPDNLDAYDRADGGIPLVSKHYDIEAIDITDTPEAQAILEEIKVRRDKTNHINDLKKKIETEGTLITLVNGKPVSQPEGTVLFDDFGIYGTGERLIETDTEYWYLINNGGDGSHWGRNTVITGGAGAYGWVLKK